MKKKFIVFMISFAIVLTIFTPVASAKAGKLDVTKKPITFVYVKDVIPDAQINMQYYGSYNFVGRPIIGYNANVALFTSTATNALKAVDADLELKGYDLKIYDAYRPQKSVDYFLNWSYDLNDQIMKAEFYPNVNKSTFFSQGYLASRSAHTRGSAVDLTLVDKVTGQELDMGCKVDMLDPISSWGTTLITPQQTANRNILKTAMQAHGFKTISSEWWHWIYINEMYPRTYWNFDVQ